MKKTALFTLTLCLLLLTSCANEPEGSSDMKGKDTTATMLPAMAPDAMAAAIYTCSMDTDVVSNAPGKCPKCGMDLIEKK